MALIHLDAGVLIGFLDDRDAHHPAARTSIAAAIEAGDRLAMATSALAECLVGPARHGAQAIDMLLEAVRRLPITTIPLDVEIATAAAVLRARHRALRLPDALVIATAAASNADRLITTDGRWPSPKVLDLQSTTVQRLR